MLANPRRPALALLLTVSVLQVARIAANEPSGGFWSRWLVGRPKQSEPPPKGPGFPSQPVSGDGSDDASFPHCSGQNSPCQTPRATSYAVFDSDSLDVLASAGRVPGSLLLNRIEDQFQGTSPGPTAANDGSARLATSSRLMPANSIGFMEGMEESKDDYHRAGQEKQVDQFSGLVPRTDLQVHKSHGRTCWADAYVNLMASCKEILSNDTRKAQLSLHLANCFLEASGRATIDCAENGSSGEEAHVKKCLGSLTDHQHSVYLAFYLDCPSICHFLQANLFKMEVEKSVNSLKATAGWLGKEITGMSKTSEEILEAAAQTRKVQENLLLQQQRAIEQVDVVKERVGTIQDTLESVDETQKVMAKDAAQGFKLLEKGANDLGLSLQESRLLQLSLTRLQAEALDILRAAKLEQELLVKQHKEDLWQLFQLALKHQDRTEAWHAQMEAMQQRVLSRQETVEENLHQAKEEQLAATQKQSDLMGDLAARTVAYHSNSLRWQAEASKVQEELLLGQRKVTWGIAAAARDMEEFHQQELQWSARFEQQQEHLAAGTRNILRVQDEFAQKQKDVLGLLDRVLSFQSHNSVQITFIVFYGTALAATLLLTCAKSTFSARIALLIVWACALAIEWHLHKWMIGQQSSSGRTDSATSQETSFQGPASSLLSVFRWLYATLASAILLVHAFNYRDLAATSHAMLQRQSSHFQSLLWALQEVAQNFRQERQQHNQHRGDLQANDADFGSFPPDLVLEARVNRHSQNNLHGLAPGHENPPAEWQPPEDTHEDDYEDEVESGDEAASPLVTLPRRKQPEAESGAASQYFTAVEQSLVGAKHRREHSRALCNSRLEEPNGFGNMSGSSSIGGCFRRAQFAENVSTPRVCPDTSSRLSSSLPRAAGVEEVRRSPRLARLRELEEHRLQQEEATQAGPSMNRAATMAARLAVKRAVGNCRRRGLAPGSYVHPAPVTEFSVEDDSASDEDYEPPASTGHDWEDPRRVYNLRPRLRQTHHDC